MAPPSFVELGKLCRDLLTKGYLDGYFRIDARTSLSNGLHFSASAQGTAENNVIGFIESKFRVPDTNVYLTGRWHSDNLLFGELALIDQFTEGLKLALQGRYNLSEEGSGSGLFVLGFGRPAFKFDMDATLASKPLMNLSLVLGHEGFLAGWHGLFDSADKEFKKHNFALGYVGPDYVIHLGIMEKMSSYLASVFFRLNEATDLGVEALYKEGDDSVQKLTLGTRYRIDEDSLIRAKINTDSILGLGYQRRLREGITAYVSAMIVTKDIQGGEHKAGVGLEIEI